MVFSTKIVKKLNCHHSIISRLVKLNRETIDIEAKNGSGRKRTTRIVEDRYLKRLRQQNCHVSAPHLKVEVENTRGVNILSAAKLFEHLR